MRRRIAVLLIATALICAALPLPAMALPDGWWPFWSAYQEAVESDDDGRILEAGDGVIGFYSDKKLDKDIANQLYMVYLTRLDRLIFEKRSDYASAVLNCERLVEICGYLRSQGGDYSDMITRCENHLGVLPPRTGVYAVSYTSENTYGSGIAAASGTYYGTIIGGHYEDAGICSFYAPLEGRTAGDYDYLIRPLADGKRVIMINLNFSDEGDTARLVPKGSYDEKLRSTLGFLAELDGPVLLRIGAEMDVWTKKATAEEYVAAYNYIGNMARKLAPEVELIWSPNYTGGWNRDISGFYPDDSLVDWVGLSLYYNYDSQYSELHWLEAVHQGRFADPVYNADSIISIAKDHNKPVIATEGGAIKNGPQGEAYAVRQVAKEFSTLNMVYPEVKAIVYFDKVAEGGDYTLTGSVLSAADAAIAGNPALIKKGDDSAGTWVPIDTYSEKPNGELVLGAAGRTFMRFDMGAVYRLDGKQIASTDGSPNRCVIRTADLTPGKHCLEVMLSDGSGYTETKSYTLNADKSGTVTITAGYSDISENFTDIDRSAYYYDAVVWAANSDVTTGTSKTTFSPEANCTRGQVVTFLWRAMGKPEPQSTENPFTDVKPTDYFYKPMLWAVEQGITAGTSKTTFSPGNTCTNAHIITFLWRAMGKPGDTGAKVWYEDAVNWASGQGLLRDIGKEFVTDGNSPRADVVTYLYRVLVK